jgi:LEA14-like dessication related protein
MVAIKHFGFVFTLVLLLIISGCAGLGKTLVPPQMTLVHLEVKEVRALEVVLQIDLRLLNPNDVPIDVKGMDCELSLNGQNFAFGVSKTDMQVPPFSTEVIPITFYSSFLDLARSIIDLERNKSLKFEISGRVHIGNGFLFPSVIPFRTERELSFEDITPRRR